MRKRVVDLTTQRPALDIASFGRRGPGQSRSLTPSEIAYVSRTIRRVPEVMIKVSGGARTLAGVRTHLDYISREGEEPVETDEAVRVRGKGFENALMESWDLDLDAQRRHTQRSIVNGRKPPRLVHNLVFSMPKGTPPDMLLAAVRVFARETFALRHLSPSALQRATDLAMEYFEKQQQSTEARSAPVVSTALAEIDKRETEVRDQFKVGKLPQPVFKSWIAEFAKRCEPC